MFAGLHYKPVSDPLRIPRSSEQEKESSDET
jgi:hypothetical protein